jgi:uncharacterized protein (DUF433 family)
MERVDIGQYIVIDPEVCHGQMTFKGTRIPVDAVMTYLGQGYSVDVLLHSWPELSRPAIEEAVSLATESLQTRFAPQLTAAAAASYPGSPVML